MEKIVLFVGRKFHSNTPFQDYIRREIEKTFGEVDTFFHYTENDNSLFLHLERLLNKQAQILIFSTKASGSVIGKLLCTITSDNQILKENMLIPSSTSIFEENTYLLQHKKSTINVLTVQENTYLPPILIKNKPRYVQAQVFDMDIEGANALLNPLAQTYEVKLHFTTIIQGWLLLTIESKKYGNITQFISSSRSLLNTKFISSSNIAAHIIEKLSKVERKISLAESCTGGLIANYFTKQSGASNIFDGSLVTYSNLLKENWLAVDGKIIQEHGAVSKEVVLEMSEGCLNVSDAHYAISVSGVAGPDGGSDEKPVGTVYICVRSSEAVDTQCLHFNGDRNYVQDQASLYAIKMLLCLDKELFFT